MMGVTCMDSRGRNKMTPETLATHARLEAWGAWAKEHAEAWPALVGPLLLTLLFQGSTKMTEDISVSKYPEYRRYQETTSRIVPLWPGARL